MRKRRANKSTTTTQEKILELVHKQQQGLRQSSQLAPASVLLPKGGQFIGGGLIGHSPQQAQTQTQFGQTVTQGFIPAVALANQQAMDKSTGFNQAPAHFKYPEINMALTCNYFGPNDYRRKQTIKDVRMKVIEERQQNRSKNQHKIPTGQESSSLTGGKSGNGNNQQSPALRKDSSMHSWLNGNGEEENLSSMMAIDNLPAESIASIKDVAKLNIHATNADESGSNTPAGCKGVQIDSSLDFHSEYFQKFEQLGAILAATPSRREYEPMEKSVLQMSTKLFNGEYLIQTMNQNTPTQQISQTNSNSNLPEQIIQQNASPEQKREVPKTKDSSRKQTVYRSHSKYKKNRSPPESPTKAQQQQHHVTYFAGPQINQINLHVHFNSSSPRRKETSKTKQAAKGHNAQNNERKHVAQNHQPENIMMSKPLADQGSKQTLNQSSSKALQEKTLNNLHSNQQSHTNQETPFNMTLNKYSSLQQTESQGVTPDINRQGDSRLDQTQQKNRHSGELVNNQAQQSSLLGLCLNSIDSSKSIKKLDSETFENKVQQDSGMKKKKFKGKLDLNGIHIREMQESNLTMSRQQRSSPNRNHANDSKLSNDIKTRMSDLTEVLDPGRSELVFNDKHETEQVINQIINQLSNQKRSATIHITTHNRNKQGMPRIEHPNVVQNTIAAIKGSPGAPGSIANVKQKKMRRNKFRSSTNEPKPIPQLHIYNYLASKVDGLNARLGGLEAQQRKQQLYNTIHGSFTARNETSNQSIDQRFQTQGNFNKGGGSPFVADINGSVKGPNPGIFNKIPDMYQTIMQPGQRWTSCDFAKGAMTERAQQPMMQRFNPNQTGFSTHMSSIKDFDRHSVMNRSTALDQTLYKSVQNKPLSLEMRPEKIAEANGESTVLFKVPPNGKIGRFRPREKRKRETYAQRQSRLGNINTRTSIGVIKDKMEIENPNRSQDSAVDPFLTMSDGFMVNQSEMMKTETTVFSKMAMEREIKDLEQMIVVTPGTPGLKSADKSLKQPTDQVIYEESVRETHVEPDDDESHMSHAMTTFASVQTQRLIRPSRLLHSQGLGQEPISPGIQSTEEQTSPVTKGRKATIKLAANNPQTRDSSKLNQQQTSPSNRIAFDKLLLDKIKQISAKQQRLATRPQNTSPIPKYNIQSSALSQSPKRKPDKKSTQQNLKLILESNQTDQHRPRGIQADEILEGQSIHSIKQNSQWSMLKPPVYSDFNSPSNAVIYRGAGNSPNHRKPNHNHIVVVQTPETLTVPTLKELKPRLDIKIRCPSQLLLPEVIQAINRKLDLTISLVYYDGSQPLSSIQNGQGPRFTRQGVQISPNGFIVQKENKGGQLVTRWNLYDDMFYRQIPLEALNFHKRCFVIEIELSDPNSKDIYLLRYLTFNSMSQTSYPKIFITIMQHLWSKQRALRTFDCMANEVLDLSKEPALQKGTVGLDKLFEKLVIKGVNYPILMKLKPRIECPPIRMKGIILESPKRKVQIKGLGEFISLADDQITKPRVHIPNNRKHSNNQAHNESQSRTIIFDSRETLRPDYSDSQYVAVPLTNHELSPRPLIMNDSSPRVGAAMKSSFKKHNTSSMGNIRSSPRQDEKKSTKVGAMNGDRTTSSLQKSQSPKLRTYASLNRKQQLGKNVQQLNYESASRINLDLQTGVLDPCIQVKKITERQLPKTPPQKIQEEVPKPINKQQFHIDPNLEKSIDCSFEALGSSEGRHSMDELTPLGSTKRRRNRNQRFSSSVVDELESGDESKQINETEILARQSRQNLNYGSNMSELEDENNDTFGASDIRLQSIFTMKKKESDLQEKLQGGLLIMRGSKTELGSQVIAAQLAKKQQLATVKSKDSEQRSKRLYDSTGGKSKLSFKALSAKDEQPLQQVKHHLQQHTVAAQVKISVKQLREQELDLSHTVTTPSHDQQNNLLLHDAGQSTDFDESTLDHMRSLTELGGAKHKSITKKEQVQKSIVNILADEVIKEPAEPSKHRTSGLSHMTKRGLPRRSNLKHALAVDEKSKKLLANDHNLQIQRKELQQTVPSPRSPRKSPGNATFAGLSNFQAAMQLQQKDRDIDEQTVVDNDDIQSIRRDSLTSFVTPMMNPTLHNMASAQGPEVIIVRQGSKNRRKNRSLSKRQVQKSKSSLQRIVEHQQYDQSQTIFEQQLPSPTKTRTITFEKGGKEVTMQDVLIREQSYGQESAASPLNQNKKTKKMTQHDSD